MPTNYELVLARPARQAVADKLPPAVAEAAVEILDWTAVGKSSPSRKTVTAATRRH